MLGGATIAASEQQQPEGAAGMPQGGFQGLRSGGDGAKIAFVLPIRLSRNRRILWLVQLYGFCFENQVHILT